MYRNRSAAAAAAADPDLNRYTPWNALVHECVLACVRAAPATGPDDLVAFGIRQRQQKNDW